MTPSPPEPASPRTHTAPALDLDLAFGLEADLEAALLQRAGPLGDPLQAEPCWREQLVSWLEQLADELPPPLRTGAYSLGLETCRDTAIAALNQARPHTPGATDVLAFAAQDDGPPLPSGAGAEDEPLELGDIVISLETAARQAEEHGHGLERELRFLASHGLLHLLGWDHPDPASLALMLERQERLLA
ncbi:MAG: rRNA maturation RNase YbeY [Cyanobacteria bacterium]|nr:rRNA maturation RNase YbeY [Cyanobacteriota bacterium]